MLRRFWPRIAGFAVGCGLAVLLASMLARPKFPLGPILSECDGRLRQVVIQYVEGSQFVLTTYQQFLAALPADVEVVLVCPDAAARDELLSGLGQKPERFRVILTGEAMTTWSRDRWVALRGPERTTLFTPAGEAGADSWPARRGDQRIAGHLAQHLPGIVDLRSRLQFDGGDFLADGRHVFVAPAVLQRNPTVPEAEITAELEKLFGRKIIHFRNAPNHHVGMYLAIAGDGVAIVGDPSMTKSMMAARLKLGVGGDWSAETQKQFDDVAGQLKTLGYRVVRIATAVQEKEYVTYVNGIIDVRDGVKTVYMPTYQYLDNYNRHAAQVWSDLGYTVRPIDCTDVFRQFGTLHCLVNVLARS